MPAPPAATTAGGLDFGESRRPDQDPRPGRDATTPHWSSRSASERRVHAATVASTPAARPVSIRDRAAQVGRADDNPCRLRLRSAHHSFADPRSVSRSPPASPRIARRVRCRIPAESRSTTADRIRASIMASADRRQFAALRRAPCDAGWSDACTGSARRWRGRTRTAPAEMPMAEMIEAPDAERKTDCGKHGGKADITTDAQ